MCQKQDTIKCMTFAYEFLYSLLSVRARFAATTPAGTAIQEASIVAE